MIMLLIISLSGKTNKNLVTMKKPSIRCSKIYLVFYNIFKKEVCSICKYNDLILLGMLLKNSIGLYKQTKQIELSKVMFCLIIMMMIESVLHTHTHLQSLTTKCYCEPAK